SLAGKKGTNFLLQYAAVDISECGQRVLSGVGGGECRARPDDPESALLGGFALGPGGGRSAGIIASSGGAGRRHRAGVDGERGKRTFLRGVAAGGRVGI